MKTIKSHYLRASDSLNYGLEIEKNRFSWNFAHFLLLSRDEQKCIFFSSFHFRIHGNHDFLFLAFSAIFWAKNYNILDCPTKEAMWQMFVFVLSNNKHD